MSGRPVLVEFFFAGGCERCAEARSTLREAAESVARVEWKEIDVARNPNRVVDLGVVSTPAVALDGELVFKSAPGAAELRSAIEARAQKA